MDTLLRLGLGNALWAAVLAAGAAGLGRLCRRPALTHGLWLLVLLKLLTPPLISVAVFPGDGPRAESQSDEAEAAPRPVRASGQWPNAGPLAVAEEPTPPMHPEEEGPAVAEVPVPRPAVSPPPGREMLDNSPLAASGMAVPVWQAVVLGLWLAGCVVWWGVTAGRVFRFRRLLRHATAAPAALQEQARNLARRLGLKRCPGVWLVPAPITPSLWALGIRPRLLLPSALWQRLTEGQRQTLLAHELAHLRRRDHWVRRLELVVLGLYWWLPIAWWARHELREAEEQCCDAWVVWALPAQAPAYATALVETIAFLSQARSALPVAASGIGHFQTLKRRLTMILRGTPPRALSGAGLLAVLALGLLALPLVPTWAPQVPTAQAAERPLGPKADDSVPSKKTVDPRTTRAEEPTEKAADPARSRTAGERPADPRKAAEPTRAAQTTARGPALDVKPQAGRSRAPAEQTQAEKREQALEEVELLEVQLAARRAEVQEGVAQLKQAQLDWARLEKIKRTAGVAEGVLSLARSQVEIWEARLRGKQASTKEAEIRLKHARRRLAALPSRAVEKSAAPDLRPDSLGVVSFPQALLLGPVKQGTQVTHKLQLINPTRHALRIGPIRISAGCLTVTPTAIEMAPRSKAVLKVLVDSKRFVGPKEFRIFIPYTGASSGTLSIRVQADSRRSLPAQDDPKSRLPRKEERPAEGQRLRELEKRLDLLQRELESLRRELRPAKHSKSHTVPRPVETHKP